MRGTLAGVLGTLVLAGCGHAPTSASFSTAASIPAAAPAAAPMVVRTVSATPAPTVTVSAPPVQASDLDGGPDDPPDLVARLETAVDPPSVRVDDRTAYGIVVTEIGAHTATISWATEVPTRGVIHYGRSWGFDQHGYTDTMKDDLASEYHKLTITGLRRFTGYEFEITTIDALGLSFDEKQRSFRTKFWAWR